MPSTDTIAAIATASGRGGIGIIRVSGSHVAQVAQGILKRLPKPRYAELLSFLSSEGNTIDHGIALFFPAPHSFTGEDVLELHSHGSPIVLACLLREILQFQVRIARPGEFTERAFLNRKIDLTQAEAIADIINAASEQAARAASRSLQGEFSKRINELLKQLIQLRIYVESAIDFSEEEIDFLNDGLIEQRLSKVIAEIKQVNLAAKQGNLLQEGLTIVIAGKPNAGKSSLLNNLCGRDAAIVTPVAGTTRDILREYIHIDGLPIHIIDTAGIRESEDQVEQEGIKRALAEVVNADHVLLISDSQEAISDLQAHRHFIPNEIPFTLVRNKIDLSSQTAAIIQQDNYWVIDLSAKTGEGVNLLRDHLKQCVGFNNSSEGHFMARRRHIDALIKAELALGNGLIQLQVHRAGELLAEDLREAQNALAEITGEFTADDLLGQIFANFCIGK